MSYTAFDITERLIKTKEIYKGLTVPMMTDPYYPSKHRGHGTGDRLMTLGYLRGWALHAKAPSVLMRASYAEAEDARINPEAHRDLIVRIGGYSDYFIRLAPVLQQEIIDKTEY